jgi:DNA-directed RNA polymerase subunit omega
MARITIEDCMEKVPNRFQLVRMASIRAKQLKKGARPLLVSEENKEIVMALREIAGGFVKPADDDPNDASVASAAASETLPAPAPAPAPEAVETIAETDAAPAAEESGSPGTE